MSAASVLEPDEPSEPLPPRWIVSGRTVPLDGPVVMGILNVTPDSFSDGGELATPDEAVARADAMVEAGARILDVGGESTRPGADPVPAEEELRRVLPVIEALASRLVIPISIDTRKARVAAAALAAGATIVNDVSALRADPAMAEVVASSGAGVVLMHMRGTPADMQKRARYGDVAGEVVAELRVAVLEAERSGVRSESILVDPGIGFAKTPEQNLRLLREMGRLGELGRPIMVGPSRKSFLGQVLGVPPAERVAGTVAACVLAYRAGARVFRVHDVEAAIQGLAVAAAVEAAV